MHAIEVNGLRKAYGSLEAVRGIDFSIEEGEVFGVLGPNGAGKTTTVEILEGYRKRDAGEVRVLGHDPDRPGQDFRERIGVVLQQSELWPNVTVREAHAIFAGYYRAPRDVDEVVALVGLQEKASARVKSLSGGQKRRLDLGIALIGDPDLVFLDEPTTGFDPQARRAAWEMIRSLRSLGKTVLLTTHYLDEAEQLADRVAVMRPGKIACRWPGRSSPGSSVTGARTPPSPALRFSSSCDVRAGSSSGSARRLCRLRRTSPRSSPRRSSCSGSRPWRSSCSDALSTARRFLPTSARSWSPS